jgi:hypothetical protein
MITEFMDFSIIGIWNKTGVSETGSVPGKNPSDCLHSFTPEDGKISNLKKHCVLFRTLIDRVQELNYI